jgi:hypothetical protein
LWVEEIREYSCSALGNEDIVMRRSQLQDFVDTAVNAEAEPDLAYKKTLL